MTRQATARTEKPPFGKGHLVDSSATAASLACSSSIHFDELSTECYLFVGQHTYESTPTSISNVFGEAVVFDHVADLQVFNSNAAESGSQPMAEFVQEVSPLVGNLVVLPCQPETSLAPVPAAFLLLTQSPIQQFQPSFAFDKETRIAHSFAIGQGGEVFDANINANRILRKSMGLSYTFHFASKDGKPLPSTITLDCESLDFALWNSVQDDWNISDFGTMKMFVINEPKTIFLSFHNALRVGDTLYPTLETRKAFFPTRGVFDSAKEVPKSLVESVASVLKNLGKNKRVFLLNKKIKFLPTRQFAHLFVSFDAQFKKFVINCFANVKLFMEDLLLPFGRIQTIPIHLHSHSDVVVWGVFKTLPSTGLVSVKNQIDALHKIKRGSRKGDESSPLLGAGLKSNRHIEGGA